MPEPALVELHGDEVVAVDVACVVEEDGVAADGLEAEGEDGARPGDPAGEGQEGVRAVYQDKEPIFVLFTTQRFSREGVC